MRKLRNRHWGGLLFDGFNIVLMIGIIMVTLAPLLHVFAASLSDAIYIQQGKIGIWPRGWTMKAYRQVFIFPMIFRSYGNTILYTVSGTCLSVVLTAFQKSIRCVMMAPLGSPVVPAV